MRRSVVGFVLVFLLEIDLCLCLVDKKGQENARKFGQENARKSGYVFLCLKSRFVFFVFCSLCSF